MIRTIEREARIEHGRVIIDLPGDVPDGPVHVRLTIESASPASQDPAAWLNELEPTSLAGWPADSTFGREELYDDDGR
jgi:hypothetical protein